MITMKTLPASLLRAAALASALFLVTRSTHGATPADRATELLALQGSVPVRNAGPYVEVGTYAIQVSTKLGRPAVRLADGAWLYPNHEVGETNARGTLVVRFAHGRVADLRLVNPAVVSALIAPRNPSADTLVAQAR
jgi:hypothetical protein